LGDVPHFLLAKSVSLAGFFGRKNGRPFDEGESGVVEGSRTLEITRLRASETNLNANVPPQAQPVSIKRCIAIRVH